jgi:hypothetical protein
MSRPGSLGLDRAGQLVLQTMGLLLYRRPSLVECLWEQQISLPPGCKCIHTP